MCQTRQTRHFTGGAKRPRNSRREKEKKIKRGSSHFHYINVAFQSVNWQRVVLANILYTLTQLDNSKHRSRGISRPYLRIGRSMFCHAILITRILWDHIRVHHATSHSKFLSARQIVQNQNLSIHFPPQKTHRNTHDKGRDKRLTRL